MSMDVKNKQTPLNRLRKVLANQQGIIRTAELAELGIPRTYLSILERNGEIERISRGVYQTTSTFVADEWYSFQARYKTAIFSHETALFLHDLTDRTPLFFSVTVPSGYHSLSLNQSSHKVFYVQRQLFGLGVIGLKSPLGNEIKATDLERTICDILRSRNQIDIQLVNDAIKRYTRGSQKNIDRLYHYARQFKIQKTVRATIEILL
jgi:predicted transcriptional regulator of viral defense system